MIFRTFSLLGAVAMVGLSGAAYADTQSSVEAVKDAKTAEAEKQAEKDKSISAEKAKQQEVAKQAAAEKAAKDAEIKAEAKKGNPDLRKQLAETHKIKLEKLAEKAKQAEADKEKVDEKVTKNLPFDVRFESEKPGLQQTTATFKVGGVETFDKQEKGNGQAFKTDFNTGGDIVGVYRNVTILPQDQYGGANGKGNYAVTFDEKGYTLDLYSNIEGGVNYFGYWLSALDKGNSVTFFSKDQKLFTFNPSDVIDAVNRAKDPKQYYGNPNEAFKGQNEGEPYVFVNFFNDKGSFDKIVFAENPLGGGYESDNHTVGHFLTKGSGTVVPISGVPEPTSWAMLIAGMGMVGMASRRRRGTSVAA